MSAHIPLVLKDPDSVEFFTMDWGTRTLSVGVEIATSGSTWIISGPDALLTKDQESILTGNRSTRLRLTGGTVGKKYTVTNRIITNESPAQTKDASFVVFVQNK